MYQPANSRERVSRGLSSKLPINARKMTVAAAITEVCERRQMLCNVGSDGSVRHGVTSSSHTELTAPAGYDHPSAVKGSSRNVRTPVAGVPVYHSRPAATAKIFLDFDGDSASYINKPRYDADGNALYSDAEQTVIQNVWERVSELYSPFNVDVTTEDPGNRTGKVTAHAVITSDSSVGSVSGEASIGGFINNNNWAWIGVGSAGAYWDHGIGVVVGHEVGHLMNLWHQGTLNAQGQPIEEYGSGEPNRRWIMGGNENQLIRDLWRNGPAVRGPGSGSSTLQYLGEQDDLAILAGSRNGFGYRVDDWSNSFVGAPDLTDLGQDAFSIFEREGVIETTADVDTFAFTSYGQGVTINLTRPRSGMLDATLELRRVNGSLVDSRATSSLNESMSFGSLPRGKYYLQVKSAGNYGDIGQYHLNVQVGHVGVGRTFVVTSGADSGPGTLRQAILDANAVPAGEEPPQIIFNRNLVLALGETRLRVAPSAAGGELPAITRAQIIDGASQPVPDSTIGSRVVLDGISVTAANSEGLRVNSVGSQILNLNVQRWTGDGIAISGDNNTIAGCYVGLDATGTAAAGNWGRGISLSFAADGNTIGGPDAEDRNVIAANGATQLTLDGQNAIVPASAADNNLVQGNYIGTNASGSAIIATNTAGIELLNGAHNNTIEGNLFAGLTFAAVSFFRTDSTQAASHHNTVKANRFGVAANNARLGITREGIYISRGAYDNLVELNTIAASTLTACVSVVGDAGAGNIIRDNDIGTNAIGASNFGGAFDGIYLSGSGTTVSGNTIVAHGKHGIFIDGGDNNVITGNRIGIKNAFSLPPSSVAASNAGSGIALWNGANNNRVGGTTAAERNVIAASGIHGVDIAFGSTGNQVLGNYIGTHPSGSTSGSFGNAGNGVQINASSSNNVVRGNVISGNAGGVHIGGTSNGNVIAGNLIGTNSAGTAALGNTGSGVMIDAGAAGNTIGGSTAADRNIISGNGTKGVYLYNGPGAGNVVVGNYIGLAADGNSILANGQEGVVVAQGAVNTRIGGSSSGERNVISGNAWAGIAIFDASTTGTLVRGNYLGTDVTGSLARPNDVGVYIGYGASGNIIGGSTAGERNVVSGNLRHGVWLDQNNTSGNTVAGNYIGLKADGTAALGNGLDGIHTENGARNNTLGGVTAAAGNVISGNGANGIQLRGLGSSLIVDTSNVRFNRVGTNAAGTAAVGNHGAGILVYEMSQVQVLDNLVSGNNNNGIQVYGGNTYSTVIERNVVGADASGSARLGNQQTGIYVENSAIQIQILENTVVASGNGGILAGGQGNHVVRGNHVGTNASGASNLGNTGYGIRSATSATGNDLGRNATPGNNVIAYNTGAGVVIDTVQANSTAHTVRGNSIYSNGGLGIDIAGDGVTLNDLGDADTGPNGRQNFPVIRSAVNGSGTQALVSGVFNAAPGQYTLDFYSSPSPDASGYGEGRTLLLSTNVVVNASGEVVLSIPLPFVASGNWISATATELSTQATSEFSAAVLVMPTIDTVAPAVISSTFAFDASPHSVRIVFSESVAASLQTSDVTVLAVGSGIVVPVQSVSYDPATNTATFGFASILPDGNYRFTLNGSSVSDVAGNTLGINSVLDFHVLTGDANRDRTVGFDDLLILAQNYGQSGRTFSQGDFNYDAVVDFADLLLLAQRYGNGVMVAERTAKGETDRVFDQITI